MLPFKSINFNVFSSQPGVYRMLDANGKILYVGKAKNLKKRLASYLRPRDPKTLALISQVEKIETTCTSSENEALLLEGNLIKTLKPRYNIVLKDDRSFPYLSLSAHAYPRLSIFRGTPKGDGDYFGPFPHAQVVHEAFYLLQKIFKLRSCTDSYFRHRSRPCLQYQIKRCRAPCVGLIDAATYQRDIEWVKLFLAGKSSEIIDNLSRIMNEAAAKTNYEQAAELRDQIADLKKIQQQQYMVVGSECVDVVAVVSQEQNAAINILQVRNGLVLWDKAYFVEHEVTGDALTTFLTQYYLSFKLPTKIIVNLKLSDRIWLQQALTEKFGYKVKIIDHARGVYAKWVDMAENNAHEFLSQKINAHDRLHKQMLALRKILGLKQLTRIECFDVSHTGGEATLVANVVFDENGPLKSDYRKFNIKHSKAGDDYGALQEALLRRYRNLEKLPDILMMDGGKGQLQVAVEVCNHLQIKNVMLLAIAKGVNRKNDTLYTQSGELELARDSMVLHLLQRVRDEAHRFAISGHRKKLLKKRTHSVLEEIKGIGHAKCTQLLTQFGGLESVTAASVEQLAQVKGIGKKLALYIYKCLHER